MIGQAKKVERLVDELDAAYRGGISELYLLWKSDRLSDKERAKFEARFEGLLRKLERECAGYNGGKEEKGRKQT